MNTLQITVTADWLFFAYVFVWLSSSCNLVSSAANRFTRLKQNKKVVIFHTSERKKVINNTNSRPQFLSQMALTKP